MTSLYPELVPEPPDIGANLAYMRNRMHAPVDSMGCERIADESADPAVYRYQALIALMLSSQTKDEVTADTMVTLRSYGLNPLKDHHLRQIAGTSVDKVNTMLAKVGFHNRKAKYIKDATQLLLDQYGGDPPPRALSPGQASLCGPKMAPLFLPVAYNKVDGIGVDVHLHRIADRLGWTQKATNPEATRTQLEDWMPRSLWPQVNPMVVGLGQVVCTPVQPQCYQCLASQWCPSSKTSTKKGTTEISTPTKLNLKREVAGSPLPMDYTTFLEDPPTCGPGDKGLRRDKRAPLSSSSNKRRK
eukprot:gene2426-3205_t